MAVSRLFVLHQLSQEESENWGTGRGRALVKKKTKRMFRLPANSASSIIGIIDGKLINVLELVFRERD